MPLRSFLGHLEHDPTASRLADEGGSAFVSQSLRPFLLAALAVTVELTLGQRLRAQVVDRLSDRAAAAAALVGTVDGDELADRLSAQGLSVVIRDADGDAIVAGPSPDQLREGPPSLGDGPGRGGPASGLDDGPGGAGNGSPDGTGTGTDGTLAFTGSTVSALALWVAGGAVVLGGGLLLVRGSVRRQRESV